jgi:uncharacterized protein YjbI with pentapeptide repeats
LREDVGSFSIRGLFSLYAARLLATRCVSRGHNLIFGGVDLSQSLKLDSVSLEGAYLQGANFSGADMSRANLEGTNLYHANLSGTVLWEASLKGANLAGADLTGANLTRANLNGVTGIAVEILKKQAKSLQGATMPDGSKHD